MSIAYKLKHNKRAVGNEVVISNEQHQIGISGVFTITPNTTRLIEVPLQEMPSSVVIPGYSEVPIDGPAPGSFQFAVDYGIGDINFNAAQNGQTVFVTYKGRGSEVDAQDVNELQIPVGVALNQDGSLVAGIVHPVNISAVLTDDFTFPRNVFAANDISVGGQTLFLNTAEVGSPTLNAQLTVNRGSSPSTSLRWNESIDAWEFINTSGTANFQIFDSGAISFIGTLQVASGSAAIPSYSFSADPDTGMYDNGANDLGFSTGGVLKWHITSLGIWEANPGVTDTVVAANDGTIALTAFGFVNQTGVGMYRIGSNNLGFATNSILQLGISTTAITTELPIIVNTTAGTTSATFTDNTNSTLRIEHPASNVLAFDVATSNLFKFTVNSVEIARLLSDQAQFGDGTFSVPGISFLSDPTMGFSVPFANTLGISISGAEVARFTPTGDFQILENEKIIVDGTGEVFLKFNSSTGFIGQSTAAGDFAFGSANSLTLFTNSFVGEPNMVLSVDGTISINNSTQGTASTRAIYNRIFQDFSSGYHRTLQFSPTGAGLGVSATATVTVVNYLALSGSTLNVNGSPLTEGAQWTAATSNNATATSLASAITGLGFVTAVAVGALITITVVVPGSAGNSDTLTTSDAVNLTISGPTFTGGVDDFVLAFGYQANGTGLVAATIDSHDTLPISITINDTEVINIASTSVAIKQTVDVNNKKITSVQDPTAPQDAATKAYVDSVSAGLDPKASSRAATTAALPTVTYNNGVGGVGATLTATVNGALPAQDGQSLSVSDRLLVKNQVAALQNGIYTVTQLGDGSNPFILTRATDQDGSPTNEVSGGNFTFIESGTVNAGQGWVVVWPGTITVGTDPINWTQFSAASTFTLTATDPGSPTTGQVWFNTTTFQFKGYNGTSVVILG